MKYSIEIYILATTATLLVGGYSFRKKSISLSGLAALVIISNGIIWIDQIPLVFILFYMFASSSALTILFKKHHKGTEKVVNKSGPRDYVQALANLGVATTCVLAYHFLKDPIFIVALIGSVAASNADSWASEIGACSKRKPVSILNLQYLPKGVSGGITSMGTMAGLGGSIFIVIASTLTIHAIEPVNLQQKPLIISTTLAGFLGMLFDSLLGALFQALYKDPSTLELTENPRGSKLIKGVRWMNNDMVNLLSAFFAGSIAALLYHLAV